MGRPTLLALSACLACTSLNIATAHAEDPNGPAPGTTDGQPVMQPMGTARAGAVAPATTPTTTPVSPAVVAVPVEVEEEHPAPNSIFAEGMGAGLFYSVNYERLLFDQLGLRVGISYMSYGASAGTDTSSNVSYFTVPLTAEYLGLRSGKHVLEIGAGSTLLISDGSASAGGLTASGSGVGALGTAHIGYRIHPVRGGFQFRVGAAMLYGPGLSLSNPDPNSWGVLPWFYVSAGASF
jgi:hypothetical protein